MVEERQSRKRKPTNILVDGITTFIAQCDSSDCKDVIAAGNHELSFQDLPKRYVLYHPMLLLNTTFTSHSSAWQRFFSCLSTDEKKELFRTIVDKFQSSGQHVTHVAVNAPIQVSNRAEGKSVVESVGDATTAQTASTTATAQEGFNVMRSPFNLQPLYGDFGPDGFVSSNGTDPEPEDFDAAFWVETAQIKGIKQVWAPRWTMFSQGNIREKSRIMGQQGLFPGLSEPDLDQPLSKVDVVDLYVGIGYFAFPYLRRGVRRVFGWEINGWSVEGLRRGCERNGWECLVVEVVQTQDNHEQIVDIVVQALQSRLDLKCVVFHGDNKYACNVLQRISSALNDGNVALNIRHCNLGLLPTSQASWEGAVALIDSRRGGWLHVHENAEIAEVDTKRRQVVEAVGKFSCSEERGQQQVSCVHTEMVKTYAPGVGHYVFDIRIQPPS